MNARLNKLAMQQNLLGGHVGGAGVGNIPGGAVGADGYYDYGQ